MEQDPYAVLGVSRDADHRTIAAAHRSLARRYHPDVSREADSQRRMAEINAAYALLRDPGRRAQWDLANRPHAHHDNASAGASAGGAGGGSRQGAPGAAGQGGRPSGPFPGQPAWRRGPNGEGAAGPPPGSPSGSVLPFGRHIGWSLGEIARVDPGYLAWLKDRREGAPYHEEIERILERLRRAQRAAGATPESRKRRFPFG